MVCLLQKDMSREEQQRLKDVIDNRKFIALMNKEFTADSHTAMIEYLLRKGEYVDSFSAITSYGISDVHKSIEFLRKKQGMRIVSWKQVDSDVPFKDKLIYALNDFAPVEVQKAWKKITEKETDDWKGLDFEQVFKNLSSNGEEQLTLWDVLKDLENEK